LGSYIIRNDKNRSHKHELFLFIYTKNEVDISGVNYHLKRMIILRNILGGIKKNELVSSHTARRSFCTSKFLKGLPASVIVKFSDHSSERSFLKYLKLDTEVVAKKYKAFF
jgi:integrase